MKEAHHLVWFVIFLIFSDDVSDVAERSPVQENQSSVQVDVVTTTEDKEEEVKHSKKQSRPR